MKKKKLFSKLENLDPPVLTAFLEKIADYVW